MFREVRQTTPRFAATFPIVYKKLQCPICMECYSTQELKVPKVLCESKHTICYKCLSGIVRKGIQQGQLATCPLCRGQIKAPVTTNLQLNQLTQLTCSVSKLEMKIAEHGRKVTQLEWKSGRQQRELKQKDKQILSLKSRINTLDGELQILHLELKEAKNKCQKETICQKSEKDPNQQRDIEIDGNKQKKAPLRWFCQDMVDDQHLTLAKKQYTKTQIEFMVFYDMTKLVVLNLSLNNIGNEGFEIFCQDAHVPNLKQLKICNNQITQLPQTFDLSNFSDQVARNSANLLKNESFLVILQQKWQNLKSLGLQLENDNVWDSEQNLTKLIQQIPEIVKIYLSQLASKITKVKCKAISSKLNEKVKRPQYNRIKLVNSN